jgi:dTDP-4-amino-4,6-dideoxygalactose transaminase
VAEEVTALVPLYGNKRENTLHADRLVAAASCLSATEMLQSGAVDELEEQLAKRCGRRYAVAVNSCTDALAITLRALGIGTGDEVLVSDYTFVASASAVARAGARPVFVDVEADGLMDLSRAEAACTSRTRALVIVDLLGAMHDPRDVEELARRHGLWVVEDAAQALGARYAGRPAGSVGEASCLSFDPTKHLSAPGSGGMLLTDDPDTAERARMLRYHGRDKAGLYAMVGYNSQMSTFSATMLLLKLDDLDRWQHTRMVVAQRYLDAFEGSIRVVSGSRDPALEHAWQKFVVASDERDKLAAYLADHGVQSRKLYSPALHAHPVFAGYIAADAALSRATRLAETCLSLPIHAFLDDDEVTRVIEAVLRGAPG